MKKGLVRIISKMLKTSHDGKNIYRKIFQHTILLRKLFWKVESERNNEFLPIDSTGSNLYNYQLIISFVTREKNLIKLHIEQLI